MGDETRTSAQARIATSAPKLTYGKHKNSLLPLTGINFLHSDALDATNDRGRLAASNAVVPVTAQHSADTGDSPLSDVEPVAAEYKLMVISPRRDAVRYSRSTSPRNDPTGWQPALHLMSIRRVLESKIMQPAHRRVGPHQGGTERFRPKRRPSLSQWATWEVAFHSMS